MGGGGEERRQFGESDAPPGGISGSHRHGRAARWSCLLAARTRPRGCRLRTSSSSTVAGSFRGSESSAPQQMHSTSTMAIPLSFFPDPSRAHQDYDSETDQRTLVHVLALQQMRQGCGCRHSPSRIDPSPILRLAVTRLCRDRGQTFLWLSSVSACRYSVPRHSHCRAAGCPGFLQSCAKLQPFRTRIVFETGDVQPGFRRRRTISGRFDGDSRRVEPVPVDGRSHSRSPANAQPEGRSAMRIAIFTETFLPKIDGISNRLRYTVEELVAAGHEVRVFGPATSVEGAAGAKVVRVPGLPFPALPGVASRSAGPSYRLGAEALPSRSGARGLPGMPRCVGARRRTCAPHPNRRLVPHRLPPLTSAHHGLGFAEGAVIATDPCGPQPRPCQSLSVALQPRRTRGARHPQRRNLARGSRHEAFSPSETNDGDASSTQRRRGRWTATAVCGPAVPEKMLDTVRPVLENLPYARLAIVGDGPARSDLERHYAGFPVVFTGFLRGEELAQAFASGDVFIMPSTTETLGFVVLEAIGSRATGGRRARRRHSRSGASRRERDSLRPGDPRR